MTSGAGTAGGGTLSISSGASTVGAGGVVEISTPTSSTGDTGNICFTSGTAESGNSGNVTICAGGSKSVLLALSLCVAAESTAAEGDLSGRWRGIADWGSRPGGRDG